MTAMLVQVPLPWLPGDAEEIAPGVGVVASDGGGVVWVHGLATFAWDAGDEAARRLAAVQLVRLRAAAQRQVAAAFETDPVTVWRWDRALREERDRRRAADGGGQPGRQADLPDQLAVRIVGRPVLPGRRGRLAGQDRHRSVPRSAMAGAGLHCAEAGIPRIRAVHWYAYRHSPRPVTSSRAPQFPQNATPVSSRMPFGPRVPSRLGAVFFTSASWVARSTTALRSAPAARPRRGRACRRA